MEAGDYDKAVAHAQAALEKDPGNAEYLDLLSDAQTAAADQHYDRARALAGEHRPTAAMAETGKALEYMPAHPDALTLQTRLRGEVDASKARVAAAAEAMAREDWTGGLQAAEQARAIDADDVQARQISDRARSALLSRYLTDVQVALQAGKPDQARAACEQARRLDADNPFVRQMLARLDGQAPAAGPALAQAAPREAGPALDRVPAPGQPLPSTQAQPTPAPVQPGPSPQLPSAVAHRQPAKPAPAATPAAAATAMPTAAPAARRPADEDRRPTFLSQRPPASAPASRPVPAAPPRASAPPPRRAIPGRIEAAPARAPQPAPQPPAVGAPARAPEPAGVPMFKGTISRDDRRYPKELPTIDGLIVKLKDTDGDPLDCDLEIRAGGSTARLDDLKARQPVGLRGISGRTYTLVVTQIVDDTETVHFSIEPRVPVAAPPPPSAAPRGQQG